MSEPEEGESFDSFDDVQEELSIEKQTIPEWKKNGKPGVLWLRQLDALTQIEMTNRLEKPDMKNLGMFIVFIYCACKDKDRTPMCPFSDEKQFMEHLQRLQKQSFRVLNRLQRRALALNAIDKDAQGKLKNASGEEAPAGSRIN